MQDGGYAVWWLNSGPSMAGASPPQKVGSGVLLRVKTFFETWNLAKRAQVTSAKGWGAFPTLPKS
jgi:hypothetical protein